MKQHSLHYETAPASNDNKPSLVSQLTQQQVTELDRTHVICQFKFNDRNTTSG